MKKNRTCILIFFMLFIITGCSSNSTSSNDLKQVKATSLAKGTLLMFKNVDDDFGDLYIKIMGQVEEKVATNVSVFNAYYDQKTERIYFIDNESNFYKFNRGKDKEKIATNVSSFTSDYENIFYYTHDSDLYVVQDTSETEKIGSEIYSFDLLGKDLYYINNDQYLKKYNIDSKTESPIASDVREFKILSSKGSLIFTNKDDITYYKDESKDSIKIASESINYYDLVPMNNAIFYTVYDDEEMILYHSTLSSNTQTKKVATGIKQFKIHNNKVYYVTSDNNLFVKPEKGNDAQKLASDVLNFEIDGDMLYYNSDEVIYKLKIKGSSEKTKVAQVNINNYQIKDGHFIYSTDEMSLYVEDIKLTSDLNGYQILDDTLVFSSNDSKLYRSHKFGTPTVVEEDISEYVYIFYNNALIYSHNLGLSDLTGYWEYYDYHEVIHFEITENQIIRNLTLNEEYKAKVTYSDLNYIDLNIEYYGENENVSIQKLDNDSFIWRHQNGEEYEFNKVTKEQATSYY